MRSVVTSHAFALVIALACAEACSLAPSADSICADDGACAEGTVCAFGLCVDPAAQTLSLVDVEVEPETSSGWPVQAVFDVDLRGEARVDVPLAAAGVLVGTVERGAAPLAARVLASPSRRIAGRSRAPSTTTDGDGTFVLPLVQGRGYALGITPEPDDVAPWVTSGEVVVDTDVQAADAITAPLARVVVHGRAVAGTDTAALGMPGLVAHIEVGGRRVSTTGTTDADGAFELSLYAALDDATLVIAPSADNAFAPRVRVPVSLLPASDVVDSAIELGDVQLGDVRAPVPVRGVIVALDGTGVARAAVHARGDVGAGSFVARVDADDEGRFELLLLPGRYDLAAVAPVDAGAGLVVQVLDVTGPVDDVAVALPDRVATSGRVVSADGASVEGASVTLQRVGDVGGVVEAALGDTQPAFVAATDATGSFAAHVDPGRYRVTVQPSLSSSAPVLSSLITVGPDGLDRRFRLPQRAVLAGTVRGPTGEAAAHAVVRVFSRVTDEAGAAIFLGEAIAGDDGAFDVPLPDVAR